MHATIGWTDLLVRVTKRDLGLHYLAGTGIALSVLIVAHALVEGIPAGGLLGLIPSLVLASVVYWLPHEGLDGESVWRIAQWGGLGIGLLSLGALSLLVVPDGGRRAALLVSSNVALGGLVGVLLGVVRIYHERVERLRQKHSVLNRVLRHDLRNAMALVRGHAESLEPAVPGDARDHLRQIERTVDDLVELSWKARRFQRTLDPDVRVERVDAAAVVRECVEGLRREYPEATIETDLPEAAWAYADELLDSAIDDVLENAIEHNEGTPRVEVSVRGTASTGVVIEVADDGPGIPDRETAVLDGDRETSLDHSGGIGLWIVQWLIERYGGDVTFDRSRAGGTLVRIVLREAPPP